THTWVGDLAVTLTAPNGTNYLVMADEDNDFGGCGTSSNNINVCIQTGTGNPLTNNTEYMCNGGNPCLVGNWTMPCGGVTDPVTGALQAPTCNLNDFNQPGAPANGVWTLTVNDICSLDVGFLETWSLKFACGIDTCYTACEAEGGFLDQPALTACFGDDILSDLNVQPTFPGITPNPNFYDYAFILTQGGVIQDILPSTDLTGLGVGTYEICGISFEDGEAGSLIPYIGSPLSELQDDLSDPSPVFCADLSSDCFSVTIQVAIPFTFLDTMICAGDCFVAPNGTVCCNPGTCEYNLTAADGCDSTIMMDVQFIPLDMVSEEFTLCQSDCVTIDGVDYCPPGVFTIVFANQFGCDSTLTLTLNEIPVEAVVAPADTVTCVNPIVTLDASNSTADAFTWF
ncbi:MAG: hypothetical protein KDC44_21870, partial [Phaeodactylibacter sp.]|nr:hypothetical protein [Phaeodactylibacter sp.]